MSKNLERKVSSIWRRDADDLYHHADALSERADRQEAASVAGLSLDDAALRLVANRTKPPTYFELFDVLKYGPAAHLNVVQFFHVMRQSALVRMNGIRVVRRRKAEHE